MILQRIMDIIYELIQGMLFAYSVPKAPDAVIDTIDQAEQFIIMGIQIANQYFHVPYLAYLLSIVLRVEIILFVYHLIMWVVEKIPVADIDR